MIRSLRSRFVGASCGVLLGAVMVAPAAALEVAPPVAEPASGLVFDSIAAYRPDPAAGTIGVSFTYSFENASSDAVFPGFFESLPAGVTDLDVATGGASLNVAPVAIDGGTSTWLVEFLDPLEPGESTPVDLQFTIPDTATPGTLAAPGVVAVDAYVPGMAGRSDLEVSVEVPQGYVAASTNDHTGFAPYEVRRFHFVNVELFVESTVDVPPLATLSYWASDVAWADEVGERAEEIGIDLERWFGPRDEPFTVQRVFDTGAHPEFSADLVALSDERAIAVDHQLAHIWLADAATEEAWFLEGLALGFAGERGEPGSPEAMVASLVGDLGASGVRAVVDALRAETSPYPGPTPETRVVSADWRLLLDLVEGVGGVDDAATGFREAVTSDIGDAAIDRRASARLDYDALAARSGSWSLPRFLRVAMESWDFDTFSERQTEVSDVIATRDSLATWAASLDLSVRGDGETEFEDATDDLAAVVELQTHQAEALEAFDEAERIVNGDRGLLARVGLWGSDPDAELSHLRDAWAEGDDAAVAHDGIELAHSVEGAVGRGTIRLLVPALAVLGAYFGLRFIWRSAVARRPEADESALVENL